MTTVRRRFKDEDIDQLLRVFKKNVGKDGILRELKRRQYYEKPCEIRNRAKRQGIKNWRKKQAAL
jgi:small subunit ribosomal protein S21